MGRIDMGNSKVVTISRSMQEIQNDCKIWATEIEKSYIPDLIVFIAKSGYLFAKSFADYFNCDMVDVLAKRPANGTKDGLKSIMKLVPEKLVLKIVSSPLMYKYNENKKDRCIELSQRYYYETNKNHKNILIIDDSVDTGWTLLQVENMVKKDFPNAVIKTASYSVIEYSQKRISVDYERMKNTVVLTCTSRKSKEYDKFINDYEKWIVDKNQSCGL
jgi:hypoxanthine phosphoribosyltransferase